MHLLLLKRINKVGAVPFYKNDSRYSDSTKYLLCAAGLRTQSTFTHNRECKKECEHRDYEARAMYKQLL